MGKVPIMHHPMGAAQARDDYGRRVSEGFDRLPSCRRVEEDIVVFSETYKVHKAIVQVPVQVHPRPSDIAQRD